MLQIPGEHQNMGGYIAAIPLAFLVTITLNEWALVYYELLMMILFSLLPGLQHTLIEIWK